MWVKMIFGFDDDGLLIPKWRDAFLLRGAFVGELSLNDEDVPQLRRRSLVARLTLDGKDLAPPLVDAVLRYVKYNTLTISGISEHEPWNRWKAQAWRMEITDPVVLVRQPTGAVQDEGGEGCRETAE